MIQVGAFWTNATFKTESAFELSWQDIASLAPAADDFPGVVLTNNALVNGNPEYATPEPNDPWYWIRERADWYWSDMSWGQLGPSNRTMIYKFTPDQPGTTTVKFYEIDTPGSETGESIAYLFDGLGVTDISDLDESRLIDTAWYVWSGEALSFTAVAGRDYYLWVTSDDLAFGPENRYRLKVQWPSTPGAPPPNDDVINAENLDDGNWHPGTTDGATWENLPGRPQQEFETNLLDNLPVETPEPATVWYKASFGIDDTSTKFQFRNLDTDLILEYWRPFDRIEEHSVALVDTACTITDGVAKIPLINRPVSDTAVTLTEALAFSVTRKLIDTGATVTDVVQKGPADTGARITDTLVRRVGRRMTDNAGSFFGPGAQDFMANPRKFRGRAVTDTGATVSDSIAIIDLTHFNLVDTGATISDTITRPPVAHPRTIVATATTISDELTRIPPVTVTDTGATVTDTLARTMLVRGLADRGCLILDSVSTNRHRITDYGIDFMFSTLAKTKRVSRNLTDTACTITDGVT